MRVAVDRIVNTVEKISAMTIGDKQIPGVLLYNDNGILSIRYNNSRKTFIEDINVIEDEGDIKGFKVVDYGMLKVVNVNKY